MSDSPHCATASDERAGPDLAAKLRFLRGLLAAGDEAIETHFAWVFLIGDSAYKLRKPVRRNTMDYSTLEARRIDAAEQLRLNRRLAPTVYLDCVALTLRPGAQLVLGGSGTPVEWLVRMRRLDRSSMLDAWLARGGPPLARLAATAALLADFYRHADPAVRDTRDYAARLHSQVEANGRALGASDLDPDARARAAGLCAGQLRWIDAHPALLADRVRAGRVIEAHGDLRPEHVFLGDPPCVIDCLEFDRELRIMDTAEELSFLDLECERLGAAWAGRRVLTQCLERLGDVVPVELLAFYRGHRAMTRAKVYAWRATEPDGASPQSWLARAAEYLGVAAAAAQLADA